MDTRLKLAIRNMTEQELYDSVFTDHMTGVNNRRALDTFISDYSRLAIVDLDSLKWLNDEIDHRMGDLYLKTLAHKLEDTFGSDSVYRLSGDEFVILCDRDDLYARMKALQTDIKFFSFGLGENLVIADEALTTNKLYRESSGARASRGETPPWANNLLTS